jgi:glucokinase
MPYVIGLDVGGTTIKGGVFAGSSQCLAEVRMKTYVTENSVNEILANMRAVVEELMRRAAMLGLDHPGGIGIGVPGFVNSTEGVVLEASNLGLYDVNLKRWFEERYHVPCVVQGDARVGAIAEREFGAAQGHSSLLYVVIGTGVGSGMVVNGEVYEGVHSAGGELGHTIVNPDGDICACGKRGCLETIVAGPNLIRAYEKRLGRPTAATAKDLSDRALEGHPDAKMVFREAAQALALAIANYCTLFDPSIVVVGGGVSLAGPVLFEPLLEFFNKYSSPLASERIVIAPAALGDKSGTVGASLLVQGVRTLKEVGGA